MNMEPHMKRLIRVAVVFAAIMPSLVATATAQDLSGVWLLQEPNGSFSKGPPAAMTPWGVERFTANKPTIGPNAALDANDPTVDCVPPGVPYVLVVPTPIEFVQIPEQVIQLFEYSHFVRRIYTDGRAHPTTLQDTGSHEWMGHSIGTWEGNTFVVDTIGFNDKTWLDRLGRPHSDALHVVERIRYADRDTLEYGVTIDDPKAYAAPWQGQMVFKRRPGWELGEHTCVAREDAKYLEFRKRAWEKR